MTDVRVRIDGREWTPENEDTAEYDAIHCAAGAVLAGATEVQIFNDRGDDDD
ncbi:hypothetical protein U3A55_12075 [Salarchaeum sp. III]|uniref:hypothetical protein n=1 Tax=Salarchaeum sp. III TaxID=3107927 RepID=UPI002ED9EA13